MDVKEEEIMRERREKRKQQSQEEEGSSEKEQVLAYNRLLGGRVFCDHGRCDKRDSKQREITLRS